MTYMKLTYQVSVHVKITVIIFNVDIYSSVGVIRLLGVSKEDPECGEVSQFPKENLFIEFRK